MVKKLIKTQEYIKEIMKKLRLWFKNSWKIEERQNSLLGKINSGKVLWVVAKRTIAQQKPIEEIKNIVDPVIKEIIIQTKEKVVNKVAQKIAINGARKQAEFCQEMEQV